MDFILDFLPAVIILGVQYFLSTRRQSFWGAILPVLYVGFLIYGKATNLFTIKPGEKGLLFIGILGTVILLGMWADGRERVTKKRQKEMDRLEAQNL
ncbi:hypothetical protein [Priestia koreensis]|uniref:hypothetical protein n=1 Tax=Priestia koreensis TaxID=284581 RepID=UPI0028F6F8FA|nr:hypothetical protein [Priestia koreensis]